MRRFDDKVIVVTGGLGGLGAAMTKRFSAEGATVEVIDILDGKSGFEDASTDNVSFNNVDVTQEQDVSDCIESIALKYGHRIDILVNNAGVILPNKSIQETTTAEFSNVLEINLLGYFTLTKACIPLLKNSSQGRIINVASRTFYMGNAGQAPYVASKGGIIGFTRVLARELGEFNITVNAIAPGMVRTPATVDISDEVFNNVMNNQAIKRAVTPDDFAGLAAFVASSDASMITGQMMLCDGGGYLM